MRSEDLQPLKFPTSGSERGPVAPARRTDELDRSIIEALQANGRESFRAIAARVGVSEATVRARYGRLTSEGILQVVGVTNPLGLGFEQALIGVKTSGPPSEVVASDRTELLELTNRIRALDSVVSTETFLYLEMWKQLYDWGTRGSN